MAEKSKKDLEIDSLRDKARAFKELRAHQAGGSESGGSCSWSAVSRVDETVKIDGLDNFLSFKIDFVLFDIFLFPSFQVMVESQNIDVLITRISFQIMFFTLNVGRRISIK